MNTKPSSLACYFCGIGLLLLVAVTLTDAYSAGPPVDACISRVPGHGGERQTGDCPYSIDARNWIPGRGTTSKLHKMSPNKIIFL